MTPVKFKIFYTRRQLHLEANIPEGNTFYKNELQNIQKLEHLYAIRLATTVVNETFICLWVEN